MDGVSDVLLPGAGDVKTSENIRVYGNECWE